jgi:hypothetical protein
MAGGVMTSMQFPTITEPLMIDNFDDAYSPPKPEWSTVFKSVPALGKRWSEDAHIAGLGLAQVKPDGTPVSYDSGGTALRQKYFQTVYALAFAMTEEMVEDGEDEELGTMFAAQLGRSMNESKELEHANFLSLAASGSQLLGDGQPLLSTAHPLWRGPSVYGGGNTWSNTLATHADMSETSLTQLRHQAMKAVDYRGKPITLDFTQLIVPVELEETAVQIIKSPLTGIALQNAGLTAMTSSNYVNPVNAIGWIKKIQVIRRLASTTMYMLQTDAPRGFMHRPRRTIRRGSLGDFETGNTRFKADERYALGATDPHCAYGDVGV